jgi:hypothetical protein
MKRQGRTFTRGRLRLSRFVGSRSANKTAQPKNRKVGVTRMTARSTSVERLGDSLIGGSQRKRPFPSQVRDERFHFKLNVGRQSPQPLPIEHAGTLFCVHTLGEISSTSQPGSVTHVTLQVGHPLSVNATWTLSWRRLCVRPLRRPVVYRQVFRRRSGKRHGRKGKCQSIFSPLASVAKQ